ncbi:MAG TPA: Ig-like domain-containing protein [Gemmatimonadota bacterium]|nr:Ig-like domain-containing protein [Gemmatimonadota bacterium]
MEILTGCSTIAEGTTCPMTARGITAEGQIVTNAILRWSSSAGNVAQVNDEGLVFAIGPGQAVITVEAAFGRGEDSWNVAVVPARPK